MRVFITGVTGPVGSALGEHLQTLPGLEIHALKRWRSDTRSVRNLIGHVTFHDGDVEDPYSVDRAVAQAAPERVYHLAAQSYPSESWDAPITTFRVNAEGTINVLEAVRRHAPQALVHVAGTAAQYGWVDPDEIPIRETHPMRPVSPYGVSKVAAELTARQYHTNYGLRTVVTRSFNHVGPHQGDRCSIQTFCQQMAAIERGVQGPIMWVGNLDTRRDFSHTGDVARALWSLLDSGQPGEVYNLCSGTAIRIGDIVELVLRRGLVAAEVMVDPGRLRPTDEPILVGDNSKLIEATGWKPEIGIEAIVDELLTYWRGRLDDELRTRSYAEAESTPADAGTLGASEVSQIT